MIEKVHVKNFKGIRDLDLELKKLTVLMGPNNSGKSSVLHALAFLTQLLGDITFDGPAVKLGSFHDVIFQKDPAEVMKISITVRPNDQETRLIRERTADNAYQAFDFASVRADVSIRLGPNNIPCPSLSLFTKDDELVGERTYVGNGKYEQRFNPKIAKQKFDGGNVNSLWTWTFKHGPSGAEFCAAVSDTVKQIISNRILNQLYYLSPFRRVDVRLEKISEAEPTRVSPEGSNSLALFLYTKVNQATQFEKMVRWVKGFNVSDVVSRLEKGNAKVAFEDEKLPVKVDAPELGVGSNQLFPIIVQSFACQPDSILMVEEPEMCLHAAAQAKLPYFFSDVLDEGKQVIITTHSIFVPLAIGKAVRDEECSLQVADVQLYELKKGEKGTEKTVLRLDRRGNIKNWISEVGRVEDELYRDWATILPEDI